MHKDKMCMTKAEAATTVRSMNQGKGRKAESYLCKLCNTWHVASGRTAAHRGTSLAKSHNKSKRR